MTLSQIIEACRQLGEDDPECNVTKVERAVCVADGVRLVDEDNDEAIESLEGELSDAQDNSIDLTNRISSAHKIALRLRGTVEASGLPDLKELLEILGD